MGKFQPVSKLFNDILLVSKEKTFNYLFNDNTFNLVREGLNNVIKSFLNDTESFKLSKEIYNGETAVGMFVGWIMSSDSLEARDLLIKMSDDYENLDWSVDLYKKHKDQVYKEIRLRNSDKSNHTFDKLKEWDHYAHTEILRNKNMLLRYAQLLKQDKYRGQPINIVLTVDYYKNNLPMELRKYYDEFLEVSGVFNDIKTTIVAKNLGDITSLVKKYRSSVFGEHWMDLCDLNTLLGYNMKSKISDMTKQLLEWTTPKGKVKPRDCDYYHDMEEAVYSCFSKRDTGNKSSLVDFISNGFLWIVSGSANGVKDQVKDLRDGEIVKSASKKMAIFTTFSVDEIVENILKDVKQGPFIPAVKVELGMKDRLILASPNWEYLRASYVSHHLEGMIRGSNMCPFYENEMFRYRNYSDKVPLLRRGKICLPLDAKSFDQNVLREEIISVMKAMKRVIKDFVTDDAVKRDLTRVMNLIFKSYTHWNWSFLVENNIIEWKDGVPSGLRWTALIDTMVNYGRAKTIGKYLEKKMRMAILEHVVAAGDDDDFVMSSWFAAFLMIMSYAVFGIPVNMTKNFVSNEETEFLKNVINRKGELKGYKARKVANLFFISPEKQGKPPETYDEINYSIWDTCVRRGLTITDELNQDINWWKLGYVPRTLKGFGFNINLTIPYEANVERALIVGDRFELHKLRNKTGAKASVYRTKKFMEEMKITYDPKRFESKVKKQIGASLVPFGRNNITEVKKERLLHVSVVEPLDIEELRTRIEKYRGMNHLKPFRVKQEYTWCDYRNLLSTVIQRGDKIKLIRELAHADCMDTFNLLYYSEKSDSTRIRKLEQWMSPDYEYKLPWMKNYSVGFMNACFGKIVNRMTIDALIKYRTADDSTSHREMINDMVAFEKGIWRIGQDSENLLPASIMPEFELHLRVA